MTGKATDFNDLAAAAGLGAVRASVLRAARQDVEPIAEAPVRPDERVMAPPVMPASALPELVADIVRAACASSEAHPVAVAVNVLALFCTAVGRTAFQRIGDSVIHCRPYALVVGKSAKARKGTAEVTAREVARRTDAILRKRSGARLVLRVHAGGLSTGEGIAHAIRDAVEADEKTGKGGDDGVRDKRLLVIEPEFANVLAQVKRDGNTLSATIRNMWDGRDLEPLTKTSRTRASRPHVCIVGHITGHELVEKTTENDTANGLLNRFVLLYVQRPKLVPLPQPTPTALLDELAERLADAIEYATGGDPLGNDTHEVQLSPEAEEVWCELYPAITRDRDGLAGSLTARTEVYARMLAMVFALMAQRSYIEPADLLAAVDWVDYWAASIEYVFRRDGGEADELDEFDARVLAEVSARPGLKLSELQEVWHRNKTAEVTAAVQRLSGMAPPLIEVRVDKVGKGRAPQRLYPRARDG